MIIGVGKTREVYVNGVYLSPKASQKTYNHSPDGFSWGYLGSGPAQLALAILMAFVSKDDAVKAHQEFKRDVIANLPQGKDFELTEEEVVQWITAHGLALKEDAPHV